VEIVDGDGGTELKCRSVILGVVGVEVALKWAVGISGEKNRALTNQEMAGRTFCIFKAMVDGTRSGTCKELSER
jgi:hypothetical protein